jgi:CBS-domain-containing membrane protein
MTPALALRRIVIAVLWLALGLYVAACVASVVAIFVSTEALTGLYAVVLATPWMFIVEALEPNGLWALVPVMGAMSLNAAILYLCIRLVRRL